jgi:acetyltransferase-like isoleucine patch superfamily enzyme
MTVTAIFKKIVRRIRRELRQETWQQPDFVDFEGFADIIATYRAQGAKIGEKVRLFGAIDGINPHLVSIGDYAVIGAQSALLAHCPIHGGKPVSVGAYSYIAYGALILPGVSIGKCCIIGAGAVVTRSVPDETIVAGNPALVLRKLTPEEKEHLLDVLHGGRVFGREYESMEASAEAGIIGISHRG